MSEVNPFASPLSTDLVAAVPAQPQENQWVYRKGKLLVMHKQAVLPDRCVKSNRPAYGQRLKRKLYWYHPLLYLTILVHLVLFLVLVLILQKKATIYVGLSEQWFRKRRWRIAVSWSLVLAGVAMVVAGVFSVIDNVRPGAVGIPLGILVILGGAFYGALATRLVAAKRITDDYVWLKGVHPDFLAALPPWPYEP